MKVAILGVGLIGGSIGLAARRRAGAHVCGYDPDPRSFGRRSNWGAVDETAPDLATAVAGAEVVFAAAPVGALADTVREALGCAGPASVVSDVGSTKLALDEARRDPRFVGGHPLTGAETSGVAHAREDLFAGATWYLTPTPSTDEALYGRLRELVERLGARPAAIEPDAHDRLMASVSHLPHVLANVLVDAGRRCLRARGPAAARRHRPELPRRHAGGGRQHGGLDRHIPRQPKGADRRRSSEAVAAPRGCARDAAGARTRRALAAWNERAGVDRETLLGSDG